METSSLLLLSLFVYFCGLNQLLIRPHSKWFLIMSFSSHSFLVKVDGQCHSGHRRPQGVYKVNVLAEKTITHSACAALEVARDAVPFLNENVNSCSLRVFLEDGREIVVPRTLNTQHSDHGRLQGRVRCYPESI